MTRMHVRLTGESLTNIVRELVLSEESAKAERLIIDGLEGGITAEQVKGLCCGTLRFIGDESAMEIVPDDGVSEETRRFCADIAVVYAGRYRREGRWWRPKKEIIGYGPEDQRTHGGGEIRVGLRSRGMLRRVLHYVEPDERFFGATYRSPNGHRAVVFEACGEPPSWWTLNLTPNAAVAEFLAAGRQLEQDGWAIRYAEKYDARKGQDAADLEAAAEERAERGRAQAEQAERRHTAWLERCVVVGAEVRRRAGDDVFVLDLPSGRALTIPRAPFWNWALCGGPKRNGALAHLAPRWEPVADSGMKLAEDDPWHTDWMLGAGLDLTEDYDDEEIRKATCSAAWDLQKQLGGFEAAVVVDSGPVYGVVGEEIRVVPDLSPERLPEVLGARGIITEAGGELSHLAVVAREGDQVTIMRVEDACSRYQPGTTVHMQPERGQVTVDMDAVTAKVKPVYGGSVL